MRRPNSFYSRSVTEHVRTGPGFGRANGGGAHSMTDRGVGLEHGLTNYGDRDFSLYLRRSFAQSMGYSRAMLGKPGVGIANTAAGFNNCHRHSPELLEAIKHGVLA